MQEVPSHGRQSAWIGYPVRTLARSMRQRKQIPQESMRRKSDLLTEAHPCPEQPIENWHDCVYFFLRCDQQRVDQEWAGAQKLPIKRRLLLRVCTHALCCTAIYGLAFRCGVLRLSCLVMRHVVCIGSSPVCCVLVLLFVSARVCYTSNLQGMCTL